MRATSALQPCSASNRCARRQQVGFLLHCSLAALKLMRAASCKPVFCSDTRDAMAHAAFPCRCTRLHTRREAVQCSAHSQCTLCNRPHGWKGVDLRCRRSPRSELEVFYARNEFKVSASAPAVQIRSGCQSGAREHPERSAVRYSSPDLSWSTATNAQLHRSRSPGVLSPHQGSHKEQQRS